MSSDLAKNMKATSEAFVMDFNGDWSPNATMAYRAPECEQVLLPASLGTPKRNNQEWQEVFQTRAPMVTGAKMTIDDYLAVPEERRSVVRSSMTANTVAGPYSCDYIWFFTFDESGKKVTHITEFMDSKSASDLIAKLREHGSK